MNPLHKTTIVIWTEYDPSNVELEDLAREATSGEGYCSKQNTERIEDPAADKDWDGTEFFGIDNPGLECFNCGGSIELNLIDNEHVCPPEREDYDECGTCGGMDYMNEHDCPLQDEAGA